MWTRCKVGMGDAAIAHDVVAPQDQHAPRHVQAAGYRPERLLGSPDHGNAIQLPHRPPQGTRRRLDTERGIGCAARARTRRNGRDRKGAGFVLTVEPLPTIGPSDGPGTLGRRQSGNGMDVQVGIADQSAVLSGSSPSANHDSGGHRRPHVETGRLRYDSGGKAWCCPASCVAGGNQAGPG